MLLLLGIEQLETSGIYSAGNINICQSREWRQPKCLLDTSIILAISNIDCQFNAKHQLFYLFI